MTLTVYALLAFSLMIFLIVQVVESQYVPKTCVCPQVQKRVRGPFSDLKVTVKDPNCLQDVIIVTKQKNKNDVCISPDGSQGKKLLKCWQKMKNDGKDIKNCIRRQKQKPKQKNKKQGKSRKVKS